MEREKVLKIIDNYNRLFAEKVKAEKEREELVSSWYKSLEKEMAFYLGINKDEEWKKFFQFLEERINKSNEEIKRIYLHDDAYIKIIKLRAAIEKIAFEKCRNINIVVDCNQYISELNDNIKLVRSFNLIRVKDIVENITANIEFIVTGDINKASLTVKNYYKFVNETNNKGHI